MSSLLQYMLHARRLPLAAAISTILWSPVTGAATFQVKTEFELASAIRQINAAAGPHFIELADDILLTQALPPILSTVSIKGAGHQLTGSGNDRVFLVGGGQGTSGPRVLVQINDLKIFKGQANGGDGSSGGGGGLGAGGAVFVNARADVILNNVTLEDNTAQGGLGGVGSGGGGGGLGGNGGEAAGGGGGIVGQGGHGGIAGGGGGAIGDGGNGLAAAGGGGGMTAGASSGGSAADSSDNLLWIKGNSGAGSATAGGAAGLGGHNGGGGGSGEPGVTGGGGGGGFNGGAAALTNGGKGGEFGGGGGAGNTGTGGVGGFGGGGGGSVNGEAGDGGFGGGGGGSLSGSAGQGGFGGGGGSSQGGAGGDGGFGAGGGSGLLHNGAGGIGGGDALAGHGGGGAGMGGAVFVAEGGSLSLSGATKLTNNTAIGRDGGAAAGSGLFLQGSGNLVVRGGRSTVTELYDNIKDSVGSGLAGTEQFQRWNLLVTGGEVSLHGENAYSGDTYIQNATLRIERDINLGSLGGQVVLDGGVLSMQKSMEMARNLVINSGGGIIRVTSGSQEEIEVDLKGSVEGTGMLEKQGDGRLVVSRDTAFDGAWLLSEGVVSIDRDSRLGRAELLLNQGTLDLSADMSDLRAMRIVASGLPGDYEQGVIHTDHHVVLNNRIEGWNRAYNTSFAPLVFSGTGSVELTAPQEGSGDTLIRGAVVSGSIGRGALRVETGSYSLGGSDQEVISITGSGGLGLNNGHRLNVAMEFNDENKSLNGQFEGLISGDGALNFYRKRLPADFNPLNMSMYTIQVLNGVNTYQGGTTVGAGVALVIGQDAAVGRGQFTLAGGALLSAGDSHLNINLQGGGGIMTTTARQVYDGVISGDGGLVKYGPGTLVLDQANTYSGRTLVYGPESYLELARPDAIGGGDLYLMGGGGLRIATDTAELRPIVLVDGDGVVHTGGFDVRSSGAITGQSDTSRLVKEGSGRFLLTGDLALGSGISVREGTFQIGNGGTQGSLSGDIELRQNATLAVDKAGVTQLTGTISGEGQVLKQGDGLLWLRPDRANTFLGGLTVEGGQVGAGNTLALGLGDFTLDGGGLLLEGHIDRSVRIAAGGGNMAVQDGKSFAFQGDVTGSGRLTKIDAGTLVMQGVLSHTGGTQVDAGTLRVGQGLAGVLTGDVTVGVNGRLVFGRSDITQYDGVIRGDGQVYKLAEGELVLTNDQAFAGTFHVEGGALRIGLGGLTGSLSGDVDLATGSRLIFDRSNSAVFDGGVSGDGMVQKSGPGKLSVTGSLSHTGGTRLNSGEMEIGIGGLTGDISGEVTAAIGSRVVFNRSDTVNIDADFRGEGTLVQRGSGVTVLSGQNTMTGGAIVEHGRLAVDSNARLGSGDLILDGGYLRYEAAFSNLRDIRLGASGGLDTQGFDIHYTGLIAGNGRFLKDGAGKLTLTSLLGANTVEVQAGDLEIGNGGVTGLLLGDAVVNANARLTLNRSDDLTYSGLLSGAGDIRKLGAGQLRLTADSSAFAGQTTIDAGSLRLDTPLGGNLRLNAGTRLQGTGILGGNLVSQQGTLAPGNSIGKLTLGGDLTLDAKSVLDMEVEADLTNDKIVVGGTANLDGTLHIIALPGNYAPSSTYTLLTATAVNGTFAELKNDLVFLDASVSYSPDHVNLKLKRNNKGFVSISLTDNQQAVATALDAMPDTATLANAVAGLDIEQALAAYDTLHGDVLLAPAGMAALDSLRFTRALSQRASRLGSTSRGPGESETTTAISRVEGLWLETLQLSKDLSGDDSVGSAASTTDGQTLMIGADGYWSENLLLGFALGQEEADVSFSGRAASGSQSGVFAGTYARFDGNNGLQWKMALGLGRSESDMRRTVALTGESPVSSVPVSTMTALMEAGRGFHKGNFGIRPFVQATLQVVKRDAFAESQAPVSGLQVEAASARTGEVGVGVEVSKPWLFLGNYFMQLQGAVAVKQHLGDDQLIQQVTLAGAQPVFQVAGTPDNGTAVDIALGAEVYLLPGLSLWGGLDGHLSAASSEQALHLNLQYRW